MTQEMKFYEKRKWLGWIICFVTFLQSVSNFIRMYERPNEMTEKEKSFEEYQIQRGTLQFFKTEFKTIFKLRKNPVRALVCRKSWMHS